MVNDKDKSRNQQNRRQKMVERKSKTKSWFYGKNNNLLTSLIEDKKNKYILCEK